MKVNEKHHSDHMDQVGGTKSVGKRGQIGKTSNREKVMDDEEIGSAKVKLSDRAQDMKKIREAVDRSPDVDEAKVAKYKGLISSGKYQVDSKAVADKMVDEHAYNEFFNTEE